MIIECRSEDSNKYLLNIVCTHDSNKLKKSKNRRKIYIEKIEGFSVFEVDNNFSKTTYFDAKECIWILEKWSTAFNIVKFEFNKNQMVLSANTDEYKATSNVVLSTSNHDNIKGIMQTDRFLNMIWALETISQKLYVYTDPITFKSYIFAESFDSDSLIIKFEI